MSDSTPAAASASTPERVTIFDTTLRDGEQSPGCSMTIGEKLEVAEALVDLGVDVVEAGFPIASPGDFEAVQKIARSFGNRVTICGLARSRRDDIESVRDAIADAERRRIHVFLATSSIHREHKLKMDKATIIEKAVEAVSLAKSFCDDIEFSPEDATRTELDFLCEVVERAIEAGATTVNIPDTVGYTTPSEYYERIRHLKQHVRGIENAVISTHCHDDLGLAVANSLAAIQAGARQVEVTINGIGERAGNAALEEVVMALRTRGDEYAIGTGIETRKLASVSRLVQRVTGVPVQRNKAIVGQNAFSHESGIHQHGMLQNASTYEIMRPEDVGVVGTSLVLGKHSGRHAFRSRLEELGYTLDDETFAAVFAEFIKLADKKKEVYDSDLLAIVETRATNVDERWRMVSMQVTSGTEGMVPTATVQLEHTDPRGLEEPHTACDAATGDGPIDAVFRTLERTMGLPATLEDFHVQSVSRGKDAQGQVTVKIRIGHSMYHGTGVSTDIVEAAAKAYLKALNAAYSDRHPVESGGTGGKASEEAEPAVGV